MCGIVGLISLNGGSVDQSVVSEMTELLRHRGPDGFGIESRDNLCFGHRRLSIIDLAGGAQPMYSHDRRYLVTFNGEIFNHIELREELIAKGCRFDSSSDTEVLLEGFRMWGKGLLSKLNGQFAFALHDHETREVFLARDALGEKPLYLLNDGNNFGFASELKSIVSLKKRLNSDFQLDVRSFNHYCSLNYVPFQGTLLKGIHQLSPGCFLILREGKEAEESSFSIPELANSSSSIEAFDRVLCRATELRLRSDVPVGVFLSGGLDSSIVASAVSRQDVKCEAFIADFALPGFTEADYAEHVASQLKLKANRIRIELKEDEIDSLIESLVLHGDTPLADSSSLAVYLLSRETSTQMKVVLSGDGGDELFAGYLTYTATLLARRLGAPVRNILALIHSLFSYVPHGDGKVSFLEKLERFVRCLSLPPAQAHFAWNGMFHSAEKRKLLHPRVLEVLDKLDLNTFSALAQCYGLTENEPNLRNLQEADRKEYLCSDILQKVDRMSMAHGLEVRPVFLDPSIVQFSQRLGEREHHNGFTGKLFLRRYVSEFLPWYDVKRPKEGFSIPIHHWFRTSLFNYFRDLIHSQEAKEAELYNLDEVERLLSRHKNRRVNLGFELWGIMIALIWHRTFIGSHTGVR